MENLSGKTLATIVTQHHQVVPVLEKYQLDFCCKGKRTLEEACVEKGLSIEALLAELEQATQAETQPQTPYDSMSAEQLIGHILIRHHFYVKQSIPTISLHLEKVAVKHGQRFPYMIEVYQLFAEVKNELLYHMQKEELVLFPRIKEIAAAAESDRKLYLSAGYIDGPIQVMEHEHDKAGELLYTIRQLTSNYTAPAEACTTFKVVLAELKEFEEDLHQHVHLENNLLFPKAKLLFASAAM